MKKIIYINIILIIITLISLEAYCFYQAYKSNEFAQRKSGMVKKNGETYIKTQYKLLKPFEYKLDKDSVIKEKSKKKPIIWFGCSFADAPLLDANKTPCYKISNLTGRSCINKAKSSTGTQFMYYQIKDDEIMKNATDADYIVYIFIWDHIQRLYNTQVNTMIDMFNIRYKIQNDKLVDIKPIFKPLYSSFLVRHILQNIAYRKRNKEIENNFKLFNKILKETVEISKKRYPNSKFIFVEFPEARVTYMNLAKLGINNELPENEIKEIESYGITFVRAKDLIKDVDVYERDYWDYDNIHPSEKLWDLFLPIFTEKYIN